MNLTTILKPKQDCIGSYASKLNAIIDSSDRLLTYGYSPSTPTSLLDNTLTLYEDNDKNYRHKPKLS